MVVYFILPNSLVNAIGSKASEFIPFVGSTVKFSKKTVQLSKISNPVTATTRSMGALVILRAGLVIKYPALCALLCSLIEIQR